MPCPHCMDVCCSATVLTTSCVMEILFVHSSGLQRPHDLHFRGGAASRVCAKWPCWQQAFVQSGLFPSDFHRRR